MGKILYKWIGLRLFRYYRDVLARGRYRHLERPEDRNQGGGEVLIREGDEAVAQRCTMRAGLIGDFEPCMTEIYLHIDARMANCIRTHP